MSGVVSARARVIQQGIVLTLAVLARSELTAGALDDDRVTPVSASLRYPHRLRGPGPVRFRLGPPGDRPAGEGERESDRVKTHLILSPLRLTNSGRVSCQ